MNRFKPQKRASERGWCLNNTCMSSHGCVYQEFVICNDLHASDAYVQLRGGLRGGLRADFKTAKTKLFLQPDARTGIDH